MPQCARCKKQTGTNPIECFGKTWHKDCFKCSQCNKQINPGKTVIENNPRPSQGIYCNFCHNRFFGGGTGGKNAIAPVAILKAKQQNMSRCPRCGQNVYFAEEVAFCGKKYHRKCFRCAECERSLDSTNAADHDSKSYCKSCHVKLFGPKGYGFAGGAAGLSMEPSKPGKDVIRNIPATAQAHVATRAEGKPHSNIKPSQAKGQPKLKIGSEICPRCNKTVYMAERRLGGGNSYHKGCFTCQTCKKSLDSQTLNVRGKEIYCKGCYGKQFGPKGIGYGIGAGTLQT